MAGNDGRALNITTERKAEQATISPDPGLQLKKFLKKLVPARSVVCSTEAIPGCHWENSDNILQDICKIF